MILCTWFGAAQAEVDVRVRVPNESRMHLYSPDEYTSLVTFSGEVLLQGQLLLVSYIHGIGEDAEWRVSLRFQPDVIERNRNKLPYVRYMGELEDQGQPWIELDYFHEEQLTRTVETIFGAEVAAKFGKETFEIGKVGYLNLKSYRTGVECDHRYHYAETVSFSSVRDIEKSQVRTLLKQQQGCGFWMDSADW